MSNSKGNPRMSYYISIHRAEMIRDTIKKNFKLNALTDFKDNYISVSFDPSTDLGPKSIHFWVGKKGAKEIPNTEVLLGIWDKGYQLYSMDDLRMRGINFAKESIDRPERYSGKKGDLLDAFEGYILNHDEMVGAYKFNIIKYVTRFVEKNGIEDLDKAGVYIRRLKNFLQQGEK